MNSIVNIRAGSFVSALQSSFPINLIEKLAGDPRLFMRLFHSDELGVAPDYILKSIFENVPIVDNRWV